MNRFNLFLACLPLSIAPACSSSPETGDASPVARDGSVAADDSGAGEGGPAEASAPDDAATSEGAQPTREDAAVIEAGSASDDAEAGPVDAGPLPAGTQLAQGNVALLQGVTSDDYAIYIDGTASTLKAVALAGGPVISIAPTDLTTTVLVSGPVAFYWSAVGQSSGAGTFGIWTSAHGAQALSTSSQAGNLGIQAFALSPDQTKVAFYDQLNDSGSAGNLALANVDGSGKTTLIPGVDLSGATSCYPSFAFAGDSLVSVLPLTSPGGGAGATLTANILTGPSWAATPLASGVKCSLSVDPAGQFALLETDAGLVAYPLPAGSPSVVDSTGGSGVWVDPPAGSAPGTADFVYIDSNEELKRASVGASSGPSTPTVLADGGVNFIWSLTPDANWILSGQSYEFEVYEDLFDFSLASATTPGSTHPLVPAERAVLLGDAFTTDSSHALYATTFPLDGGLALAPYTLFAAPINPPDQGSSIGDAGAPTVLTVGAGEALASVGAKVVYGVVRPEDNQAYDVFSVDTSQGGPAQLLVPFADAPFFLSAKKDKLVYTWSEGNAIAGLYVREVP